MQSFVIRKPFQRAEPSGLTSLHSHYATDGERYDERDGGTSSHRPFNRRPLIIPPPINDSIDRFRSHVCKVILSYTHYSPVVDGMKMSDSY